MVPGSPWQEAESTCPPYCLRTLYVDRVVSSAAYRDSNFGPFMVCDFSVGGLSSANGSGY